MRVEDLGISVVLVSEEGERERREGSEKMDPRYGKC